jgi:large subunit ribosomal protein L22
LTIDKAIVEMGPALKRFKAAARGGVAKRRKRMSHIRIVLTDNA